MSEKTVLDMCCGSRMFWFNRQDPRVVFMDIRCGNFTFPDRVVQVRPDIIGDFRKLPFASEQFSMVVFDPPHLTRAGLKSWMRAKYGVLARDNWQADLSAGFAEAFRVLRPGGTLIFKWSETHITVAEILALTDQQPAFGHPSGKRGGTHWICFLKALAEV